MTPSYLNLSRKKTPTHTVPLPSSLIKHQRFSLAFTLSLYLLSWAIIAHNSPFPPQRRKYRDLPAPPRPPRRLHNRKLLPPRGHRSIDTAALDEQPPCHLPVAGNIRPRPLVCTAPPTHVTSQENEQVIPISESSALCIETSKRKC